MPPPVAGITAQAPHGMHVRVQRTAQQQYPGAQQQQMAQQQMAGQRVAQHMQLPHPMASRWAQQPMGGQMSQGQPMGELMGQMPQQRMAQQPIAQMPPRQHQDWRAEVQAQRYAQREPQQHTHHPHPSAGYHHGAGGRGGHDRRSEGGGGYDYPPYEYPPNARVPHQGQRPLPPPSAGVPHWPQWQQRTGVARELPPRERLPPQALPPPQPSPLVGRQLPPERRCTDPTPSMAPQSTRAEPPIEHRVARKQRVSPQDTRRSLAEDPTPKSWYDPAPPSCYSAPPEPPPPAVLAVAAAQARPALPAPEPPPPAVLVAAAAQGAPALPAPEPPPPAVLAAAAAQGAPALPAPEPPPPAVSAAAAAQGASALPAPEPPPPAVTVAAAAQGAPALPAPAPPPPAVLVAAAALASSAPLPAHDALDALGSPHAESTASHNGGGTGGGTLPASKSHVATLPAPPIGGFTPVRPDRSIAPLATYYCLACLNPLPKKAVTKKSVAKHNKQPTHVEAIRKLQSEFGKELPKEMWYRWEA